VEEAIEMAKDAIRGYVESASLKMARSIPLGG
jgi:predicted RNase H-like HicB family nuclease